MFGRNAVTAPSYRSDGLLQVKEIFYTLQGEGPRAGQAAVFVRLAGCNLRCHFCDTDFEGGHQSLPESILKLVRLAHPTCPLVVLTGGEPFAQQVLPLVATLSCAGITVQVETAGTCAPPDLGDLSVERLVSSGCLEVVCSPKTPKMNMVVRKVCRDYKYVVRRSEMDPEDGLPMYSTQRPGVPQRIARPPTTMPATVYLQAMDEQDADTNRQNLDAVVEACLRFGYRLSLQQHKIVRLP